MQAHECILDKSGCLLLACELSRLGHPTCAALARSAAEPTGSSR